MKKVEVYVEYTAGMDRFVLLTDKHPNDAVSPVFDSVKNAVAWAKENDFLVKDYGHFDINQ